MIITTGWSEISMIFILLRSVWGKYIMTTKKMIGNKQFLKFTIQKSNINTISHYSWHKVAQLHQITLRSKRLQRTQWLWGGTALIQMVEPESKVTSSRNVILTDTPTHKSEPAYLLISRYIHMSHFSYACKFGVKSCCLPPNFRTSAT